MSANPFLDADGHMPMSVEDRLDMVRSFNLEECRNALRLPGLQKTVAQKLHTRIRSLEHPRQEPRR